MEAINLQGAVEDSVEKYWSARAMLDGRPEWSEVDPFTQMDIKNAALPFISYSVPNLFGQFAKQVTETIESGESMGLDADTILLAVRAKLSEHAS